MEDSELEEGEACSYNHNNFHNDAGIDPDVAYSYIDEKLHDVLGHFQKDFEVELTVEDLGAKFGGYGSFLSDRQQPPGGSHSIIPSMVQSHEASKSPNNRQSEGAARTSAISSVIPRTSRPVLHANSAETAPASKLQVKNDSSRPETCMKRVHTNTFEHRHESKDKTCNLTDQKSLKFRLKVPDNLSTRQNAVMNSLGLDASPSSSLDDSPSEFEGLFQDPKDGVNVSPTSILQVMTSFIVPENLILSPLPDGLLNLSEREVRGTENLWFSRTVGVLHEDKRLKTVERTDFPGGKNLCGDYWDDNEHVDKKASDVDNLSVEVHVSNLSSVQPSNSSSVVGKVKNKRGSVEKSFCDIPRGEPTELKETCEMNMKSSRAISGGKVREDRTTFPDDVLNYPNKDLHGKGKKFCERHDFDSIKGQTILNTQVTGKSISTEQDGVKIVSRKEHSSEGKRKLKGSDSSLAAKGLEESVKVSSSILLKTKNISKACGSMKRDSEDVKAPKPCLKAEDTYKDFFGDLGESDQEDNQASLSRVQDKQRDSEKVEKVAAVNNTHKDKTPGKKTDDPWASESHSGTTRNGAPHFTNVNMPDALHTTAAPANDNWVYCDKCGKWRLLPPGKNPENFPEKWVCSMLDWLPGMNKCSITEEETRKATVLKFERPNTENQSNLLCNPINLKSSGPPAEVDQDLQHVASYLIPNGGRKKNGLREVPSMTNIDCLDQLPDTLKRRTHGSIRSASVSDANQSPLGDHKFQNRSASCDLLDKEQKNKQKMNDKVTEHNIVGGDSKSSKMKGKRITDQDLHRSSKKCRAESSFVACEDQMSDHSGVLRKGAILHSSGSPAQSVGKNWPKHRKPSSSKDLKFDKSDVPSIYTKGLKEKHQVPAAGLLSRGNTDEEHVSKKRKATEFRSKQNDIGPCPNTSNDLPESRICFKEEFSENEYLKEKRSKVFNSEINDTLVSKANSRLDASGVKAKRSLQQGQNSRSTLPQQNFDVIDTFKKDSASIQPSAAAASSSSMVSVSHKAKPSSNDGKGSPVESVSSSPMRLTNCDKVRKDIVQKDECHDVGCLTLGSPRRCSDGDSNGGSDRSEAERKQKTSAEAQHGSHESSVLDFQEKDMSCFPVGQAKTLNAVSGDIRKCQFANGTSDYSGQETQYHFKPTVLDQSHCTKDDENHNSAGGIRSRKSGKGSSRSKDRNRSSKSSSMHETLEHASLFEIKPREGRNKFCEKYVAKSDEIENRYIGKKESFSKVSSESNRREKEGLDSKTDVTGSQDFSSGKRTSVLVTPDDRNTKECNLEKSSQLENVFAEATPLLPSGGAQLSSCPQAVIRVQKENGVECGGVDSVQGDDKLHKQMKKLAQQNGIQTLNSRHPVTSGQKTKDLGAPSSQRKDFANQAATAIKEAKALKHLGDPLWKSGNADDAALYYFQSTLKFLHGASLLESSSNETAKHEDMIQAMQIYSTTAKLCEFSAHEYEKSKDMAAAALAYKCIEVALMRVIYCTHPTVNRARHELQSSLQMIPLGESPSSSASDVDNLNQPINLDKATLPRGVNSPQVTVNNGVAARTRPNLTRVLSFTQNVNSAMDAARKSRAAFAAAEAGLEGDQLVEGLTAVRRALDFNFQDMEGLLRLVRLAMEAIGH